MASKNGKKTPPDFVSEEDSKKSIEAILDEAIRVAWTRYKEGKTQEGHILAKLIAIREHTTTEGSQIIVIPPNRGSN